MTRDWRKVALAVLAAAALAAVCAIGSRVEAQQTAKAAKAPAKAAPPEAKKDDAEDGEEEPAKAPAAKKKKQDPVEAQRAIDAAAKLLQSGKADQAAQALTATLGGRQPASGHHGARALYARHCLPAAEQAGAGDFRSHERALAQGRAHRGGSPGCAQAALRRLRRCRPHRKRRDRGCRGGSGRQGAGHEGSEGTACLQELGCRDDTDRQCRRHTTQTAKGGGNWFKNWFNNCVAGAGQRAPPSTASIDKAEAPPANAAHRPPAPRVASAWSSKTQVQPETAPAETRARDRAGLPPPRPRASIASSSPPCGRSRKRPRWPPRPSAPCRRSRRTRAGNRPGGAGQHGLFLPGAGRAVCDRAGDAGRVRQGQRHRFRLPDGDPVARKLPSVQRLSIWPFCDTPRQPHLP